MCPDEPSGTSIRESDMSRDIAHGRGWGMAMCTVGAAFLAVASVVALMGLHLWWAGFANGGGEVFLHLCPMVSGAACHRIETWHLVAIGIGSLAIGLLLMKSGLARLRGARGRVC